MPTKERRIIARILHRLHLRRRRPMTSPRTLYDKIWDDHVVDVQPDGSSLLYIDRHLVHEVTSPQAFEGLRVAGRKVRAPREDARRGRPQRPDLRPHPGHRRSREPHAARGAGRERARLRHRVLRRPRPAPGHRPHHRAGAGLHAARPDHRVRRLATPRRTAPSGRWRTASAPRRSSTSSPPRRWCSARPRTCA